MPVEPVTKRAVTFVDGQNLFHSARESFGYTFPNYDVLPLSKAVCQRAGWNLVEARFYTGVPDINDDAKWNYFWSGKLAVMGKHGVKVFSRSLRYRNRTFTLPGGESRSSLVREEKGIDVRIALDVIRRAHRKQFDVAVISARIRISPKSPKKFVKSLASRIAGSKSHPLFPSAQPHETAVASTKQIGSELTGPLTMLASIAATTGRHACPRPNKWP